LSFHIKHNGVTVFDVAVAAAAICTLHDIVAERARNDRLKRLDGEYGAAECALQKILALKIIQILANRNHTDREAVGQFTNIQSARFLKKIQYLLTTEFRFHRWKGNPSHYSDQEALTQRVTRFTVKICVC
jgi:hypothetical protein